MTHGKLPENVDTNAPLRLKVAAAIAYPDGSMTASGLRREAAKGRLVIERTAGKDYTTLVAIAEMRRRCRQTVKEQASGGDQPGETKPEKSSAKASGSASTDQSIATGCFAGEDKLAEQRLAEYIASKYKPKRNERPIADTKLADVLSIYLDFKDPDAENTKLAKRIGRLNDYCGNDTLADVNGDYCREYVKKRGSAGGSRRDLEDLRAAINHHHVEGYHREIVKVVLPEKGEARDRWLTREEAAKLMWTCWRHREVQTVHRGPLKGQKASPTNGRCGTSPASS